MVGRKVRLIPAARLVMRDGFTVTALPEDRAGLGAAVPVADAGRQAGAEGAV